MILDECEKIFDHALSSTTESEFCYAIEPLFKEYEILSLELGRGSIFSRARLIQNEEVYSNISDLDYPPSECARLGRLNDKGQPCFYISAREETALAEIGVTEGQLVQVAGFRILNEFPIRLAIIGEYANVQKNGYMQLTGRDPDMVISKMLNTMPRKEALKKIYIDKFFASILADQKASENNYLFSRALSKAIYSRNASEGIVFPSIKDRGGFNIGVKAEPSDKSFHNVSCSVVRVTKRRRFGVIDFNIIRSAERLDDEGDFIWHKAGTPPEIIGIYNMSKEEYDAGSRTPNDRNNLLNILHAHSRHR